MPIRGSLLFYQVTLLLRLLLFFRQWDSFCLVRFGGFCQFCLFHRLTFPSPTIDTWSTLVSSLFCLRNGWRSSFFAVKSFQWKPRPCGQENNMETARLWAWMVYFFHRHYSVQSVLTSWQVKSKSLSISALRHRIMSTHAGPPLCLW